MLCAAAVHQKIGAYDVREDGRAHLLTPAAALIALRAHVPSHGGGRRGLSSSSLWQQWSVITSCYNTHGVITLHCCRRDVARR